MIKGFMQGLRHRSGRKPTLFVGPEVELDQPEKSTVDKAEFLRFVAKKKERSATDINMEIARLTMGTGSISFDEYVFYRFYDPDVTNTEEKRRFIGNSLHWRLASKVSDIAYDAVTQDKFITHSFFSSLGFPVPETLAIVTSSARIFPGICRIADAKGLAEFVASSSEPFSSSSIEEWEVGAPSSAAAERTETSSRRPMEP
jgi:hypothetical protein